MPNHIKVRFEVEAGTQQEILIALLSEKGFEGFVQEDESLEAFIPKTAWNEQLITDLPLSCEWSSSEVEDENWNQQWESSFEPVRVGDFCGIRAHFHPPMEGVAHELVITPKMSFGTGHHATTCLMIGHMQDIDFRGRAVADFGTGTGVLAILASKLGAKDVLAFDNDENSIENSRENILANSCPSIRIALAEELPEDENFDVILANIIRSVIVDNLAALAKHLNKSGVLVVSGILPTDEAEVAELAKKEGFKQICCKRMGNWSSLVFEI